MSDNSILILCLALGILILAVSVALAVLNRRNLKLVIRIFGAGVFLSLVVMICPSYSIQDNPFVLGLALVQGMAAMLLNTGATDLLASFNDYTVGFIGVYKALLLVLLIIAPLFTVGITLSFFSDKFARIVYRVRSHFKPSYLFSEINERTLCIAEDIARKNKRAIIIFAIGKEKSEIDQEALERIKATGGTVITEDIVNVSHSLNHERSYYILCTDGSANLDIGLRLYQKYNERQTGNINMWLYTKDEISEVIFDHFYETFNVRLLNEESLIAHNLVVDYPLYNAIEGNKLSVLIVGAGNVGLEILRLVAACSCLGNSIKTEINVVDINGSKAKSIFEKTSPLLLEKRNIKFHTADVNTSEFTNVLRAIRPTYIVLTLGNENLNIQTALYIRRIYGTENTLPHIHVLIDHKRIEKQIMPNLCVTYWRYDKERVTHVGEPIASFDIKPFGSYEDTYSNLRIGGSYFDCLAVAHNATYCGITEVNDTYTPAILTELYNQIIFFKGYSDAFAVSVPYKLYLLGLKLCDDGKGDLSLLEERLPKKIKLLREHEDGRHESFMRANGWTDMPASDVEGGMISNKLKKLNARLNNDQIEELTKKTGRNFEQEDEKSLCNLPVIMAIANKLYGKSYSVAEINDDITNKD